MKKKTIVIVSTMIVTLFMLMGSTMAWFVDDKEATNQFTAGTVEIEVKEHGFVNLENVKPSDEKTKNVSVKSLGSKQTYVRVALIPKWEPNNLSSHVVTLNTNTTPEDDWVYKDGWYYYKKILTKDQETSLLLNSVTFDPNMGDEYKNATFTLTVKAEAVQASHEAYIDVWGINALPVGVQIWAITP